MLANQCRRMSAEDETPEFELGDRIYIEGGRYDQARGRIYYMDDELIRLLPEGAPDRLIDIPIVEGDISEELGIESLYLVSKRGNPAFVAQIDAHVGEIADSFGPDGTLGIQYKIKEVNEAEDWLVLQDETGGELRVDCDFKGIPLDEPFVVLRPRQSTAISKNNSPAVAEEEVAAEEAAEEDFFEDIQLEEEESPGLIERPVTQRTYPDRVQRDEMFRNMLEALSISEQKSPLRQKELRQFVEQCMLLRNEVVTYDSAGEPSGSMLTSFQTIGELLLRGDIPLARPVLEANRTLYLDKVEDEDNPTEIPGVAVNIEYLQDNVDQSNQFLATQLAGASGMLATADSLPNWYQSWETFFRTYMRPWTSQGGPEETTVFGGTKEFFRAPTPNGTDLGAAGLAHYASRAEIIARKAGIQKGYTGDALEEYVSTMISMAEPLKAMQGKNRINVTVEAVGNVLIPLQRGLGPRTTLLSEKKPPRRIESGDEGVVLSNLIFPLKVQRDLGRNRSGRLSKDITFAYTRSKTILEIFRQLGGIPEEATTGGILSVGPEGNTFGNIAIEDWIQSQPLRLRGMGDAIVETHNLGLTQREFTRDQQNVLVNKIKQLRALVKSTILNAHTEYTKKIGELRLENSTFLQGEALEEFMVALSSEPQLQPKLEELQHLLPAYKDNDLAIISGLMQTASELFLTTMAGIPGPIARERNRAARETFLRTLHRTLLKLAKRDSAGQEPEPISCPHTRSLQQIRKVRDPDDRMKLFAKFLARFQGPRKDNWVMCAASAKGAPHQLVCYHEVLLLQEFLHPREKDVIHKELLLAFSGGVFQGRYICKNCGQAISQMEFEQSIEFDDNGRPMSGRAVLIDKDEIQSEEFKLLLGVPTEGTEKAEFQNDLQQKIYEVSRQVFDVIGIYAEKSAYSHIIERVESEIMKQPSREDYAKMIMAKTKAGKMEGKALDYDILISRIIVSAVGAHVLIEIQSHVPDYIVRLKLPGCTAGFSGYPLGKEEDKTGINYISCALASIKRNEAPWNLTGFLLQPNDKKRQEMIAGAVTKLVADAAKTASVQHLLTQKRAHYEKIYGFVDVGLTLSEQILPRFLPVQTYLTPEMAAQDAVVPAAAKENELSQSWILGAHRIARENGTYVRGSPFSETSSCFTSISDADGFWKTKMAALPPLPAKTPPRGQSGSQVVLNFIARKVPRLLAESPEELFYRVFLRVCYDGPKKGFPHEPGYTHKCLNCGFVFPDDPYMETAAPPLIKELYKEWEAETNSIITKGKSALESQQVIITKETFQDILDTSHKNFRVDPYETRKPVAGIPLLRRLLQIEPQPFQGWKVLMNRTIDSVSKLTPTPSDMDIAQAYGPISDFTVQSIKEIERHVGESSLKSLKTLFEQSPAQVTESIRTYFLVPFQRLLNDYHINGLVVPTKFGPPITRDAVDKALKEHVVYLVQLKKYIKGYTAVKLEQAKNVLSVILPIIQSDIRSNLVPGGAKATPYIVAALILGVFEEFLNPNTVPAGGGGSTGYETTARVPINILEVCLSRFQLEGLKFSEGEIKNMIAQRVDAEKMTFINDLDKMSPEERKSELMMKRLGLGKWAIGGTKAIITLDPEQLERERVKRIEMGIGDFITDEATLTHANRLLHDDAFGGGGDGAEGGYDIAQQDAEDF
jgi:hypothetical protein